MIKEKAGYETCLNRNSDNKLILFFADTDI